MTQVVADLHLHSKYSRAVSKDMVPQGIAEAASKKGIDLVATADFTHPVYFRELQAALTEVGEGIYRIKNLESKIENGEKPINFLLSTELSCIYSQAGKTRRIHILVFAPSFERVEKINLELRKRGANLGSDGRPILGMSAKNLAEIILTVDPRCLLIPAHCWTPWFSLYGSNSGFDSIDECFGEYSKCIYAVESGLSSDPAMNWRIEELANRSIVSFSDAHSPAKLGREVTVFDLPEVSFEAIRKAIQPFTHTSISQSKIAYTIEFYPEEGKYHLTGHRKCGVRQTSGETRKNGTICHVCGKKLTVGVMHRVDTLSSAETEVFNKTDNYGVIWNYNQSLPRPPYAMVVPLVEILAEVFNVGVSTKKVKDEYEKLLTSFGSEFNILLRTKPEDIEHISGPRVREAIVKVRSGDIFIDPGYDGEFGKVKIWNEVQNEKNFNTRQIGLF